MPPHGGVEGGGPSSPHPPARGRGEAGTSPPKIINGLHSHPSLEGVGGATTFPSCMTEHKGNLAGSSGYTKMFTPEYLEKIGAYHTAATESVETRNESISSDDEDITKSENAHHATSLPSSALGDSLMGQPLQQQQLAFKTPSQHRSIRWQPQGDPEETQGTFTSAAPTPVSQRRILLETPGPDPAKDVSPVTKDKAHNSVTKT